ncbi:MAG: hypothetical protein WCT48_06990 [Candidatus Paceibacterota bacterium]
MSHPIPRLPVRGDGSDLSRSQAGPRQRAVANPCAKASSSFA